MENHADEVAPMVPLYNLLPSQVRKKIKALKKLQLETTTLEAKYFQEVYKLECKYANSHSEVFLKRKAIIQGKYNPSEEECDFKDGYETPDENEPALVELRKRYLESTGYEAGAIGIPDFWLTVLKNAGKSFDLIQEHDEPILKYLTDIQVTLNSQGMGFTIEFKFLDNPYFTNKVLTKEYEMRCAIDESCPWSFDGPEIVKAKGCRIDWKKGMNVVGQGPAQKQTEGTTDKSCEELSKESFFNFFSPPDGQESEEGGDLQCLLAEDYALGIFIREKIVPNAILFYTGDAVESEEEDSESESCEEDGEEYECNHGDNVEESEEKEENSKSELC